MIVEENFLVVDGDLDRNSVPSVPESADERVEDQCSPKEELVNMNKILEGIISEVDQKLECFPMHFADSSWRESIPSRPGWYLIRTNTPIAVLQSVGSPKYKAHRDIPQTICIALSLPKLGIFITQDGDKDYVVYNGEAKNLKARAREHDCGSPGTYCLALSNYEILHGYSWTFCCVAMSSCGVKLSEDKLLRLAVEQGWRARHGWPIICSR